jgi:hypothetical protein
VGEVEQKPGPADEVGCIANVLGRLGFDLGLGLLGPFLVLGQTLLQLATYRSKPLIVPGAADSLYWIQCEQCGESLRLMVRSEDAFEGLLADEVVKKWAYVELEVQTREKECPKREPS